MADWYVLLYKMLFDKKTVNLTIQCLSAIMNQSF